MSEESPFTLRRFETENRHLYYLPKDLFARLVGRRSIYLIGSRGTGKTTLLKALHWEEQLNNKELAAKLKELNVGRDYIGIYLRMPRSMASIFDQWSPTTNDSTRAVFFCLYLDLMWVQGACDGIANLILKKELRASTSSEYKITNELLQRFPELQSGALVKNPMSIKGFASLLYERRREMERWAISGLDRTDSEISATFPITQIGEVGRVAGAALARFCETSSQDDGNWHFKVCLDETECFTPFQQRALNTSVRLAETPVSFVVSYVRLVDVTSTCIKSLSLQDADREVVPLDGMTDPEFTDLAEGVATIRLRRVCPTSPEFTTRTIFGNLDINELLYGILNTSTNPEAKRLLGAAEELRATPFFSETREQSSTPPPIYESYILDRLALTLPSPESAQWEKRRQNSAEIRKRMVAAYLCICKELKTQVKYAGAEMILQMSDCCIRDYLSMLDSVFQSIDVPASEFAERRVSANEQDNAIRAVSKRKNETIPKSEVGSPVETLRLIDSLGELTARLQTATRDMKGLKSPERGLFVLAGDDSIVRTSDAMRLISEAADAGFLKMLVAEDRTVKFRIHGSLAAAYGLSYRGAYYENVLKQSDLEPLYSEVNNALRLNRVAQLADLLLREEARLPLFEGME
jgi:hypothetical protein